MTCRPNPRLIFRMNFCKDSRMNPCRARRSNPSSKRWPAAARWLALAAAVLAGLGLQACQAQTPAGTVDEASLLARIRGAVGEARCSSDSQCSTLPIGEKSCGGPEQWLPYARQSSSTEQLKSWSAELSAAAKRRNQSSGMAGICQYTPDPGAVCVAGRCVAQASVVAR